MAQALGAARRWIPLLASIACADLHSSLLSALYVLR